MGQSLPDSNSDKINAELLAKLIYILTDQSDNFPDLHIYRLNEKPYDYFMRFREVGVESEEFRAGVKRKLEMYDHLEGHRNIVRVEAA
jgi:hypothetical protein